MIKSLVVVIKNKLVIVISGDVIKTLRSRVSDAPRSRHALCLVLPEPSRRALLVMKSSAKHIEIQITTNKRRPCVCWCCCCPQ